MLRLLSFLLFVSTLFPRGWYFDASSNDPNPDGTVNHPYNNLNVLYGITLSENDVILLKAKNGSNILTYTISTNLLFHPEYMIRIVTNHITIQRWEDNISDKPILSGFSQYPFLYGIYLGDNSLSAPDNITIENIKFINFSKNCVMIDGYSAANPCSTITIQNCEFQKEGGTDCYNDLSINSAAIFLEYTHEALIQNNIIDYYVPDDIQYPVQSDGIYAQYSDHDTFFKNEITIENNSYFPDEVHDQDTVHHEPHCDCIQFFHVKDATINSNYLFNLSQRVSGHPEHRNGLIMSYTENNIKIFNNNIVHLMSSDLISITTNSSLTANYYIYHNTLVSEQATAGSGGTGELFYFLPHSSNNLNFINNIVVKLYNTGDQNLVKIDGTSSPNFDYNIYYIDNWSSSNILFRYNGSNYTYSGWRGLSFSPDVNSEVSFPNIAKEPSDHKYYLEESTPCEIGSSYPATNYPECEIDIIGQQRPSNEHYYVGAYQYTAMLKRTFVSNTTEYFINNYPNPFNPATSIKFNIPANEIKSIIIYDALGREIFRKDRQQIIQENNEFIFDGSNYSSGLYICTVVGNSFYKSHKMLLLK